MLYLCYITFFHPIFRLCTTLVNASIYNSLWSLWKITWKQESSDVISYTWIYPWKLKIWNDFFHRNHLELCGKFKRWLRKGFKPNKLSLRGLQIWWKWKVRHLLESVNGKRQQVFPFFDCISYKLLRIGPVLSPPCDFQFHFFFHRCLFAFWWKWFT